MRVWDFLMVVVASSVFLYVFSGHESVGLGTSISVELPTECCDPAAQFNTFNIKSRLDCDTRRVLIFDEPKAPIYFLDITEDAVEGGLIRAAPYYMCRHWLANMHKYSDPWAWPRSTYGVRFNYMTIGILLLILLLCVFARKDVARW